MPTQIHAKQNTDPKIATTVDSIIARHKVKDHTALKATKTASLGYLNRQSVTSKVAHRDQDLFGVCLAQRGRVFFRRSRLPVAASMKAQAGERDVVVDTSIQEPTPGRF